MRWKLIFGGFIFWALVFIEWTILFYFPKVKSIPLNFKYLIHIILIIPFIFFIMKYYIRSRKNLLKDGFWSGLVILFIYLILEGAFTYPIFLMKQISLVDNFLNIYFLISYVEIVLVSGFYWKK